MRMETYKKMYEKGKKADALKTLTPRFHDWKTDGNLLVGAYVSQAEVEGTYKDKPYNQYIFATDEGLVKFFLGSAADNEVAAIFGEGGVYAIEYLGKEEIGGGRAVNKFNISEVVPFDEPVKKPRKAQDSGEAQHTE